MNVCIVNDREAKPQTLPGFSTEEHNLIIKKKSSSDDIVHYNNNNIFLHRNEKLTAVVGAHHLEKNKEGSVCICVKSYHKHLDYDIHRMTLCF